MLVARGRGQADSLGDACVLQTASCIDDYSPWWRSGSHRGICALKCPCICSSSQFSGCVDRVHEEQDSVKLLSRSTGHAEAPTAPRFLPAQASPENTQVPSTAPGTRCSR